MGISGRATRLLNIIQFYVPAVSVEAMYDGHLQARERGKWIDVVKPEEIAAQPQTKTKTITAQKAILHDGSSDEQATKMYVIAGDKVTVLSEVKAADGTLWYFIRFAGTKVLEKWIKAETTE